ncbi:MAG: peptidoglycan D,D-transpeptidase FtsI family protein [Candidatus Limnocylindria bacterium]
MLARTDSRARALVLLIVASVLATLIGLRLVSWQVVERDWLAGMAMEQLAQEQELSAERGAISDRTGALLATSIELQSVFATPPLVESPSATARQLASVLDLPYGELRRKLASDGEWVWVERRITPAEAETIRRLGLAGIGMLPESKRVYPVTGVAEGTTLAAHVLGFVDLDSDGQYGVEAAEDVLLGGTPGQVTAQQDVAGRRIADSVYALREPVDGADLALTIDAGVQHLLEAELWATYRTNSAHGVTGLIMDAETGSILAMASFPSYDANAYASTDAELFNNAAISRQYEPGSVMKPFTVAAAIDAGAISTSDTFLDDNNLRLGAVRIQNADRYDFPYGHGPITAAEVLMLSNNVGAARIGLELGAGALYDAFRRFGFGTPTGVDLAGEATGVVWDPAGPNASGDLTAAQNAFGQGLSVTAIQLAAGYAAIANGGTLITPHVVAGWTDADGIAHDTQQPPGERIMRPETAATVLGMLVGAIDEGIASGAQVAGYTVAGKTGTAQIAGPVPVQLPSGETVERMEYIDGWVDSSFIGILPGTDPPLVTVVLLHRPAVWGNYRMAERAETVYARLMPQVLDYLTMPPDRPDQQVAQP